MTTNDAPFRFTQQGNLSILTLLPELNNVQWGEIDAIGTQVLSSLESQSHPVLIVDLSPLSYMGSAMVALIVRAWKATQPKKGKICVVCPHPGVKEVLKLAALDKVWDIVDNMDEARALVGAGRISTGTGGGGSSSQTGLWIIILILLVTCGALVAFAVKPELFGTKNDKKDVPASQSESDDSENSDSEQTTAPAPEMENAAESDTAQDQTKLEEQPSKAPAPKKDEPKKEDPGKKEQAEKKQPEPEKKNQDKTAENKTTKENTAGKPENKTEPKPEPKKEEKSN